MAPYKGFSTTDRLDIFVIATEDIDIGLLRSAVSEWVRNSDRPPTPAGIRKKVAQIRLERRASQPREIESGLRPFDEGDQEHARLLIELQRASITWCPVCGDFRTSYCHYEEGRRLWAQPDYRGPTLQQTRGAHRSFGVKHSKPRAPRSRRQPQYESPKNLPDSMTRISDALIDELDLF